jgi:hypothetical protein
MRFLIHAIVILVAVHAPSCGTTLAAELTPEQMIRKAYTELSNDRFEGVTDPAAVNTAPKMLTASWFTSRYIAALAKQNICPEGGVGPPWTVSGQDVEIKNLSVTRGSVSDTKQVITAKFTNFGVMQTVTYHFLKTEAGWRIDDADKNGRSTYTLMQKGCPP